VITIEAFVEQAHAWLRSVRAPIDAFAWGHGPEEVDVLPCWDDERERAEVEAAREWLALRHEAGFGGIAFPEKYGGRGLTAAHGFAYQLAEGCYQVPFNEVWNIGFGMVMPTLLAAGDEEQKSRFVSRGVRGELLFCQLFSEPGAGSDLGSLKTRATQQEDGSWRVKGRKIWTSMAHVADFGMLLARTAESSAPRNQAFSVFLVPMDAAGLTVTPIRQITGGSNFNEVLFENVHVSDDLRIGPVGAGWATAMTTLGHEHVALPLAGLGGSVDRLVAMARHLGVHEDPLVRDDLVSLYIRRRILDLNAQRTLAALTAGIPAGPEGSIAKLVATDFLDAMDAVAARLGGMRLVADTGEWGMTSYARHMLGTIGLHIGGGTDEVQKNMLAERVLGLPRTPRGRSAE